MVVVATHATGATWQGGAQSSAAPVVHPAQSATVETATADTKDDSGSTKEATGLVTDLACSGATQRIDVKTSSSTLHLRTSPGYRIHIEGSAAAGKTNTCPSLVDMRVLVQYAADGGNPQNGIVKWIRPAISESESILTSSDGPLAVGAPATETPAEAAKSPLFEPGDKATEDGRVIDVSCMGNEIFVKLSSGGHEIQLHARDYSRLTYDDDRSAFENRDFAACTLLKGLRASITFVVVEHKSYEGEIQSVEIEK
jgi:hypothetical protein